MIFTIGKHKGEHELNFIVSEEGISEEAQQKGLTAKDVCSLIKQERMLVNIASSG